MNNPLDIAAQITMIAWTLKELPGDRPTIEPLLQRCLDLAGLKDIQALKVRKGQGLSVFGQVPAYPQATAADLNKLQLQLTQVLASLPEIVTLAGKPIVVGPDWEAIETSASGEDLMQTRYTAPLNELDS